MTDRQARDKIRAYSRSGERDKANRLRLRCNIPFGEFLLLWTEKDRVKLQRQDWQYRLLQSKKLRMA